MNNSKSINKKFIKLKKDSLSDQIVNQIIDMIDQKELLPGQRLPSEREMASLLGISRLPVREALKSLETLRVISVDQGGHYVKSNSILRLVNALDAKEFHDRKVFLRDLQDVRLVIEIGAAALACENRTDEDIADIKSALDLMIECAENEDCDRVSASLNFHNAIIKASKNNIYVSINDCLQDALYYSRISRTKITEHYKQSILEHKEILKAIIEKDSDVAKIKMEEHLRRIFGYGVSVLE